MTRTATVTVVDIRATYDSGEPMAGGQVTIYAPSDPSTPWQTGQCDAAGTFTFTPDPSLPGRWEVQVRQAGHGDIVSVEVAPPSDGEHPDRLSSAGNGPAAQGYTPLQYVVMGASVVWGFIGTALYFSGGARRKQQQGETASKEHQKGHQKDYQKGANDAHC
jgi:nickel transport protein